MATLVSLFSGGGGLDLGLEAAGFKTLLATDVDEHSCITLQQNKVVSKEKGRPFLQDAKILQGDITTISGKDILKYTKQRKGQIDLLAGGPPCQAFSVFGKRKGRDDPRGQLVYHYLRILEDLEPKAFLFENVYGIMTAEGGGVFEELKKKLSSPSSKLKYTLSIHRLNSVDYGVPQFRDRVFIIGHKKGKVLEDIPPICSQSNDLLSNTIPWRNVENAFKTLPKMGLDGLANHIGRKHSQRIIDRYDAMEFGQRDHYTRINKLNPKRPSFTIIVGSDAGGGKGHIHPFEAREVTPRESARIQCFPDWWSFSGTSRHPIRQVGNAVPTLLAMNIGRHLLDKFFNEMPNSLKHAIELLDQNHLFTNGEIEFLEKYDHLSQQKNRPVAI